MIPQKEKPIDHRLMDGVDLQGMAADTIERCNALPGNLQQFSAPEPMKKVTCNKQEDPRKQRKVIC